MRGHVAKKQRRNGPVWYVVFDVGRDENGKRKQKWHGPYRTESAAERACNKLAVQIDEGNYTAPTKATVREFLVDTWLPAVKPTLRESTYEGYVRIVDTRIVPRIGNLRVQRLSAADLQKLYSELLEDGKLNGKVDGKQVGLSPRSVRNVHAVLRHALNDALRWDLVPRNVALAADPPRTASAGAEMSTWTGEQVAAFLDHVKDDRLVALWTLYLTTGCRRGEALGLSWDSLDVEAGRLSIRQARVLAGSYEVIVSEPKTAKGRRSVTLDSTTVAALKAHRKAQVGERLAAGSGWTDSGLVFTREDGTPLHPDAVSQRWERLVKSSKLPRIRLHDARHAHASLALAAGVNPRVVADRLGHSDVSLTLGLYSHVTESVEADAAERVANAIFGRR